MSSFHKSNFGKFGSSLPVDMDGYTHTTTEGWMSAPVDFAGQALTGDDLREWAAERAAESRTAVERAEADLAAWQGAYIR